MTADECWRLVEQSEAKRGRDYELRADWVATQLKKMPTSAIVRFGKWFLERMEEANTAELLFVARWVYRTQDSPYVSGDGWEYFRSWLVSQGRAAHNAAILNADAVADLYTDAEDFFGGEEMEYAAKLAYEAVTGEEPPDEMYEPSPLERWPGGDVDPDSWDVHQVRAKFPRMIAKFGEPRPVG